MSHDLNQILTNHKKIQSKKAAKEMCPDMEAKIQKSFCCYCLVDGKNKMKRVLVECKKICMYAYA